MTVTETLNDGLKRAYAITIPAGDIAAKVDAAIAEVAPQVRMPGFRPGKVPGNLIRRMHGAALRREALNEAVKEAVEKLVADHGLRPAMQPAVDVDSGLAEGEDVKLSVSLEVLPEVPAAEVEGIALEKLIVEVTDAELDAALARLAEQQKTFVDAPAGHKAASGDLVVMDYAGTVDGAAFEGGTGEGMEIELGSGRLIPGFEDALIGVTAGEAKSVKLTFPADYPADTLAGRPAEFAVTVKAVRQAQLPPVDETLATNLGLDSLDKLKSILKDQVAAELAGLTRTHLKRKLLDHLAAAYQFDVPPSMVDAEFETIWQQVTADADEAQRQALEAERADYARIAERRVRLGLLLSDIGQRNGVQVTQAEMNRLVAGEAARYPGQEREVQQYFAGNALAAAQLRAPLFEEKVVDFILSKAQLTERTVTRAELEAAIESEDETPTGHVHGSDRDQDQGTKPAKTPAAKKAKAKAATDSAETDAAPAEPVKKAGKKADPAPEADAPARKPRAKKAAAD